MLIAAMAVATGVTWIARELSPPPLRPLIRAAWPFTGAGVLRLGLQRSVLALAANGRAIAMLANGVQMRKTDQLTWTAVPNTIDVSTVVVSPDGEWVGYSDRANIWKIRLGGGTPVRIASMESSAIFGIFGASWGDDNRIYYTDRTALHSVSADANDKPLTIVQSDDFDAVHVLPDGRGLIYGRGRAPASSIVLHLFDGSPPVTLLEGRSGKFIAPDLLFFVRGDSLMGVRVDLGGRKVIGGPVALAEVIGSFSGAPQYDLSRDGLLAYLPAASTNVAQSVLKARDWTGRSAISTIRRARIPIRASLPMRSGWPRTCSAARMTCGFTRSAVAP